MATYIDAEGIREALVDFGDDMDRLGYPGVLESVEGAGVVGRALRNIRAPGALDKVVAYLKNVAKDLKAQQQKQDNPRVREAMTRLEQTWTRLKSCVR